MNCAFQLIYNKALQINPHLSVKNVMLQVQTSSLEMGMTLFITDWDFVFQSFEKGIYLMFLSV